MPAADLYRSLYSPESRNFQAGSGLEMASQPATPDVDPKQSGSGYKDMGKGAISAMNAGGTAGSALTSAGIMGLMAESGTAAAAAGPYALAGGLALSAYEQNRKAEAMNEQARVEEAQQRKQNVQAALNQALGATKMLGV